VSGDRPPGANWVPGDANAPADCAHKKGLQRQAFLEAAEGIRTLDLLHGKQFVGLGDALNVAANGRVLAREQVPPMSSFQREITGISGLKPDSRQSSRQSCRRPQRVARPVAPMRRLGSGE
jgi:hypothetical protein